MPVPLPQWVRAWSSGSGLGACDAWWLRSAEDDEDIQNNQHNHNWCSSSGSNSRKGKHHHGRHRRLRHCHRHGHSRHAHNRDMHVPKISPTLADHVAPLCSPDSEAPRGTKGDHLHIVSRLRVCWGLCSGCADQDFS